jgi:hypothetical protein
MSDSRFDKRTRFIFAGLAAVAGAAYTAWDFTRTEEVELAWLVQPEAPLVVALERKESAESSDPFLLRVADARTGETRGRLEIGSSRAGRQPRIFGPAGHFAWVSVGETEIRLVDLARAEVVATHEQLCERAGQSDLRVPPQGKVFGGDGRLRVQGADGQHYALSTDGTAAPLPSGGLPNLYAPCSAGFDALEARTNLHDPDLRGCFELGGVPHGFVQHASAAFGDRSWKGTLFDGAGTEVWTVEAPALVGAEAWFGHAMPAGDGVWVVVVAPGRINTAVHALELDARSGQVRQQAEVL